MLINDARNGVLLMERSRGVSFLYNVCGNRFLWSLQAVGRERCEKKAMKGEFRQNEFHGVHDLAIHFGHDLGQERLYRKTLPPLLSLGSWANQASVPRLCLPWQRNGCGLRERWWTDSFFGEENYFSSRPHGHGDIQVQKTSQTLARRLTCCPNVSANAMNSTRLSFPVKETQSGRN